MKGRPALCLAVPLALASAVMAQDRVGGEFQVNSVTTAAQQLPAVAMAADGSFVAVWESAVGASVPGGGINGRRFAADGSPSGGDFQVNTYTTESQSAPAVAMAANGSFVVVWENRIFGVSGYGVDDIATIRARRYDSSGAAIGSDFVVNELPDQGLYNPDVATDAAGNFVVVWSGFYGNSDGDAGGVHGRRFAANGTPLGSQFVANGTTTNSQYRTAIARAGGGDFVVVWHGFGDGFGLGIGGRRFAANGTPLGGDFAVNTLTDGQQQIPDVAMREDGSFLVAWHGFESNGNDDEPFSIQGRFYDANGTPPENDFQINTYTSNGQGDVAVAAHAGGFLATWESTGSAGTDSSTAVNTSAQARRLGTDGARLGADLQVNTYVTSFQWNTAVALNADGRAVVVWESLGSSLGDSDSWSILGQRYDVPLFADGFESGNTSAWSSSAP